MNPTQPLCTKIQTRFGYATLLQFGLSTPITQNANCFSNNNVPRAIFVIPGNPGCIHFYISFMEKLYKKHQIPVFGLGHSGTTRDYDYSGNNTCREKIVEKEDFITKYIPAETKLVVIGQSFGSYVAVQLMKNEKIRNQTERLFLLTPALDRLNKSVGYYWFNYFFFPIRFAFYPFLYLLSLVPQEKVEKVLSISGMGHVSSLSNVGTVENCVQLAYDEFKSIVTRDDETLQKIIEKCTIVYAKYDEWVPSACYKDIKSSYEGLDMIVSSDILHAFVAVDSQCEMVVSMISDRLKS